MFEMRDGRAVRAYLGLGLPARRRSPRKRNPRSTSGASSLLRVQIASRALGHNLTDKMAPRRWLLTASSTQLFTYYLTNYDN
ncbi:unnamed protein product [Tenebrio molitor]|nr:unnamed protein product [Tenebrio molitor]